MKFEEKVKRRKARGSCIPAAFPDSDLSCMLVSKQYLDEAARAYIRTKRFVFNQLHNLDSALREGCAVNLQLLKSMTLVKIKTVDRFTANSLKLLPALQHLEIGFDDGLLNIEDNKDPRFDDHTDLDLVGIRSIGKLLELRGLRSVKVTPETKGEGIWISRKGDEKWNQLLRQIERLLSDVITKPREVGHSTTPVPSVMQILAPGSAHKQHEREVDKASMKSPEDALTAAEIPRTESDFVRLFYSRPHALFKLVQDAARRSENPT